MLNESILWPLLFLIYIDDLHLTLKYFEVHYFADHNNLNFNNNCVNSVNEQGNHHLKIHWLKVKKRSLHVGKTTELVLS